MTFKLFIITLCVCWTMADYNPTVTERVDLGDVIRYTLGQMGSFPSRADDAVRQGWSQQSNGCQEGLGNLYAPGSPGTDNPLGLYFTNFGQWSGIKVYVGGEDTGNFLGIGKAPGNAAQDNLVSQGYWIEEGDKLWSISLSFRDTNETCSDAQLPLDIGDRIVINQMPGGVAKAIPMTAAEAESNNFTAGSCMANMGQHWQYDLQSAPEMSWVSGNLLPVVPMYNMVGPNVGKLNAVFVTSPVCQNDSGERFDNVPILCGLAQGMMCKNWCDDNCYWQDTDWFATVHFVFNHEDVVCANPISCWDDPMGCMMGRECPANTANPDR